MYKNSLIFNGIEFGDYGVIEKIERNAISGIDLTTKKVLNRNGAIYYGNQLQPLNIVFSIRLFSRYKLEELINNLAAGMYSEELKPLNYNGYITWYDAVLQSLGETNIWRSETALLQPSFFVPDPIARSKDRKSISASEHKFYLEGNYPVRPIYKATNVTDYSIINERSEEFITVNLPQSQDIWVNSENQSIYNSNGESLMKYIDWQSTFFDVYHGDNLFITAPTKIVYYERFMYDK